MTSDPLNPTVTEYENFKDAPDPQMFLTWARDLFVLDTGITDTTSLTQAEKDMVQRAIMHMAWYLEEDHASREDYFSQFNTERIGSYYYSKASKIARTTDPDGVPIPAYDFAVDYFVGQTDAHTELWATTTSEKVFAQPYYLQSPYNAAPTNPYGVTL